MEKEISILLSEEQIRLIEIERKRMIADQNYMIDWEDARQILKSDDNECSL